MRRFDERDIMFARMGLKPGSDHYKEYYKRNPDKEETDAELRSMPHMCAKGTPTFDPILAPLVDANFDLIANLRQYCDAAPNGEKAQTDAQDITRVIKTMALHYGAADVGIAKISDDDYYTHRGRHAETYGQPVDTSLKYAVVFTLKMNEDAINTSPAMPTAVESSKAYVDGAVIGLQLANYISRLGCSARCHMDGNYLLPAIPVAIKAGLGEKGRNNLLISRKHGCFARIGIVTTNMELIADEPCDIGIERFCKLCNRCAVTCPGRTVSASENPDDWRIEQEKCYKMWRSLGTDCGICISACPLGQALPPENIKNMTDDDITEFLDDYQEKHGSRNRNTSSVFK